MRTLSRLGCTVLVTGLVLAAPMTAVAVDGVILIDQNKAMTGGVTPGDAPNFPVSINAPGSYRLASNLVVPNNTTTAIEINASNVSLDLNGFAILGPVSCSSGFPCANAGSLASGYGVRAGSDSPATSYFNLTVRNGTIAGMGADGVHLLGDAILLEDLHVRDSGFSGIVVRSTGPASQNSLVVRNNTILGSGSYCIKAYGGLIVDNSIANCRDPGISVQAGPGTVARNVVTRSNSFGLSLVPTVGYSGNTLAGNNGGAAQVAGGVNLGQNLCGTAACPGAQY